jgi:hypothetical protein
MDNEVKVERISTTITGTIAAQDVTISYENVVGKLPDRVTANCYVPGVEIVPGMPGQGTTISATVSIDGEKVININGAVIPGDVNLLVAGIESAIAAIIS